MPEAEGKVGKKIWRKSQINLAEPVPEELIIGETEFSVIVHDRKPLSLLLLSPLILVLSF